MASQVGSLTAGYTWASWHIHKPGLLGEVSWDLQFFLPLPSLLFRVSPRYHPEQPQKLLFGHLGAGEGACPQEEGRSRKGKANQAPACLQLLLSPVPPAHIPVLPTPCHPAFLSPKSMLLWLGRADCLPVNSDGAQSRNVGRPGWLSLSVSHFRPVVAALAVPLTVIQA